MSDLDVHLGAIQAGDADAFGRWVAGAEPRLRASLRRYATGCDTEAVLQESLLRIWQVAPRFEADGHPDALLRFAIRVARNTAVSEIRRLGKTPPEPLETEVAPVEPDPALRRIIAFCRDKLRGKPALALDARLARGASMDDATLATSVGMRTNTFVQNISRARKLLLACLERQGVAMETLP